jgi:hypothetical protein
VARGVTDEQRVHLRKRFIPVCGRFHVLFNVRFIIGYV